MCKCLQTILYIVHWNINVLKYKLDFPGGAVVKNPPANAGDEGNGKPLQYACLGNPIDWGPWQTTIHGSQRVGCDLETKQQQKHVNYM